jgi:hypothetical protein
MSLTGDVRRSENQMAAPPIPPPPPTIPPTPVTPYTPFVGKTEAANLRAQFTFPSVPGLGLGLNAGESQGKSSGGGSNRNANQGANLSYVQAAWNASLGYQNSTLKSSLATGIDSRTDTWTASYGRNWSDATDVAPASWMLNATLYGNAQRQHLENGTTSTLNTLNLVVIGRAQRLGAPLRHPRRQPRPRRHRRRAAPALVPARCGAGAGAARRHSALCARHEQLPGSSGDRLSGQDGRSATELCVLISFCS